MWRLFRKSPGLTEPGPLDHPAVARMSPRELDDLPLPRWSAEAPACAVPCRG